MRKAPGPARHRPARVGVEERTEGVAERMLVNAPNGTSRRFFSVLLSPVSVRASRVPRAVRGPGPPRAGNGPCGWGTWDEWRRALSRLRPPPMHAVARRGSRVNGPAAVPGRCETGRKRPDGMRWAVRGVTTGPTHRHAAARPFAGHRAPGQQPAAGARECAAPPQPGGFRRGPTGRHAGQTARHPTGNPGRQAIRRRRDERRRQTRITRTAARQLARTTSRVDHDGPTDRAGRNPAQVARPRFAE